MTKVILIGDSSVGKTCIIQRLINNTFGETPPTIGGIYFNKKIRDVDINIWDTAGQERFRSLTQMYYKGAKAIIIVFDVSNISSFEGAKKWLNEIESNSKGAVTALCGNKCDIKNRAIDESIPKTFCSEKKMMYFETSAKENIGITEMFDNIAEEIKKNRTEEDEKDIMKIRKIKPEEEGNNECYC